MKKQNIKNWMLKLILGNDFEAVKGAVKFSAYTHNRRQEYTKRDAMNQVIDRLGFNDEAKGSANN